MKLLAKISFALVAAGAMLLLAACSINVSDKNKDGKDGKVDIQTPFGSVKVNTDEKSADNGIPVYPGAHLRPKENGDGHTANVNIGGPGFGLKVVAAEYETSDAPEKVKAFYEDKMKSFGDVLVCNGHSGGGSDVRINKGSDEPEKLTCKGTHGDGWEIKAGNSESEHIVSIQPQGSGTRFGTVLVQAHGKEGTL